MAARIGRMASDNLADRPTRPDFLSERASSRASAASIIYPDERSSDPVASQIEASEPMLRSVRQAVQAVAGDPDDIAPGDFHLIYFTTKCFDSL
jgi:hypothetical protein